MDDNKISRQLELLVFLTNNKHMNVEEVAEALHLSRRSVYRYITSFRNMGFIVEQHGRVYSINPDSSFFTQITRQIHFSEEEAYVISQILNQVVDNRSEVRHLRDKLARLYNCDALTQYGLDEVVAYNLSVLFRAVKEERMCVLHNYRSGNSKRVSDRIVEPYLFMSGNTEVRCYEVSSQCNKTFKLARIERVELLDLFWANKAAHREYYTDFFHFTGEDRIPVTLEMGYLAMSCLIEEYPEAGTAVQQIASDRYRLCCDVCSLKGVGRFVMGLCDDIDIVDSPALSAYVSQCISAAQQRLQQAQRDQQ